MTKEIIVVNQINVIKRNIGNEEVNSVDARELYEFLEVKKQFTDWIKPKIKDYGFIINTDFYPTKYIATNGREIETYIMTIDMAKELCMLSQTHKGKEARKYFIECEKKAKQSMFKLPNFENPLEAAEAWINEYKAKMLLAETLEQNKEKIEFYDTVVDAKGASSMSKVAKALDLGIGRNKLFAFLRDESILQEDNEPYQKYITSGYFRVVMYKYLSGNQYITHYKTLVTNKGVDFILRRYLAVYPEATKNKIQDIIQTATNMTISDIVKSDEI